MYTLSVYVCVCVCVCVYVLVCGDAGQPASCLRIFLEEASVVGEGLHHPYEAGQRNRPPHALAVVPAVQKEQTQQNM